MTIGIYQITNLSTKQFYIGQSVNIERRFMEHKTPKNNRLPIDNDINILGKDNFLFEILEECPKEKLTELESKYINERNPYYNEVCKGRKRNDEFRQRVSIGTKKWWENLDENIKDKIIKNNLNHRFPKGHKVGKSELDALKKTWEKQKVKVRIVELNKEFDSITECEKFLNVCSTTINSYFKKKIKSVKGYHIEKV